MKTPVLMTEEYWANSQLSVARFYGGIKFNGHDYIIVNKDGMDLFECSYRAQKEGRTMAIEPGEPADLILKEWQPVYRKLGRDKIIELIQQGATLEQAKAVAGIVKRQRKKK